MKLLGKLAAGAIVMATSVATTVLPTAGCFKAILNQTAIQVVYQDSSNYTEYARPFNLRLQYKPLAIVLPKNADEVATALNVASDCGLRVQAKSGGHSYASFSSGGRDGMAIFDLSRMNQINLVDTQDDFAIYEVGGGVRIGNLDMQLNHSGWASSHGTCPSIGIGGHITHGKISLTRCGIH
jgi:FAD/FMN-containing dehydrogenase